LVAYVAAVVVSFAFLDEFLSIIMRPIQVPLIFSNPMEAFIVNIKIALIASAILVVPVILYHFWAFVSVAMTRNEKTLVYMILPGSILLFFAGISFAYFLILPIGLEFLISYGAVYYTPLINISNYLTFFISLLLVFGVLFELPLIILFLNKTGIINIKMMQSKRVHFYTIAFIIGAFFTPPDIITQIALAMPVIILYEVSIFCVKVFS